MLLVHMGSPSPGEQETRVIKSNVARTCNRFSQFLKERRSSGDVGFSSIVSPRLQIKGNAEILEKKSLDLFPLTSSSSHGSFEEIHKSMAHTSNLPNLNVGKKTSGSMTIIYEGKVVVFDDLQEDMAQQIMSLASEHETFGRNKTTITTNLTHALSHLPIQRGASLHRFMEKRKDRISARSPYQLNKSSSRKQLGNQQEEHQLELKLG